MQSWLAAEVLLSFLWRDGVEAAIRPLRCSAFCMDFVHPHSCHRNTLYENIPTELLPVRCDVLQTCEPWSTLSATAACTLISFPQPAILALTKNESPGSWVPDQSFDQKQPAPEVDIKSYSSVFIGITAAARWKAGLHLLEDGPQVGGRPLVLTSMILWRSMGSSKWSSKQGSYDHNCSGGALVTLLTTSPGPPSRDRWGRSQEKEAGSQPLHLLTSLTRLSGATNSPKPTWSLFFELQGSFRAPLMLCIGTQRPWLGALEELRWRARPEDIVVVNSCLATSRGRCLS